MKYIWILALFILFGLQKDASAELIIHHEGQWISHITREKVESKIPGLPIMDIQEYKKWLDDIDQKTYLAPVNAVIDEDNQIVPGRTGMKLDRQALTDSFYHYYYGKGTAEVELPMNIIHPKVDSALLSKIRMKRIGHYETFYNSSNRPRTHNLALAVNAINNKVIFPGESFSFNEVLGERTKEKGYMSAPIIVKGEFSEGIGGGICQVSSTLYNAVDRAGVTIIKRYTHSRNVSYVPPGRDATVSWDGPDFIFSNKLNEPILIKAKLHNGQAIVEVFSSNTVQFQPRHVPSVPIK
ncbi:vancomycin resistance protein YoaR [Bacillus ectoiniformans]|uniref:VanW family protein n=1 Tax=Bacillus ectoiniformans TaxID=1494429 RepID=UPI00195E1E6A|nr:VanW family protein [Bacillus ectoiniformans]MBM7649219.1 vancomycin resistance protein YoaR [Bacillus ectoiniformans]